MCIEYQVYINMYYVSAQGVDKRVINAHYYYYIISMECLQEPAKTVKAC